MMKVILNILFLFLISVGAFGQNTQPLSQRLSDTLMNRIWTDDGNPAGIPKSWTYEQGVQLKAIEQVWMATGDAKYFKFIKSGMDFWLDKDGKLKYDADEYNIDHVTPGRAFMTLFRVTGEETGRVRTRGSVRATRRGDTTTEGATALSQDTEACSA